MKDESRQVAVLGEDVLAMTTGSPGWVSVFQEERNGHVQSELLSTPGLQVRSFSVSLYCLPLSLQVSPKLQQEHEVKFYSVSIQG